MSALGETKGNKRRGKHTKILHKDRITLLRQQSTNQPKKKKM
jgi:hypothetical protein